MILGKMKAAARSLAASTSTPKPETLDTSLYNDGESTGDETVQMVDRLRDEARRIHGPIEQEALDAIQLYFGNHWNHQRMGGDALDAQYGSTVFQSVVKNDTASAEDMVRPVINRTQNAELSNTEARTSRPVQIRYEPEETNDKAEYWLTMDGANTLRDLRAAAIKQINDIGMQQQEAVSAGAMIAPEQMIDIEAEKAKIDGIYPDIMDRYDPEHGLSAPLRRQEAYKIKDLIEQGIMLSEDLQEIDDDAVADALQKVANRLNADANLDARYLRAALNSTNAGYTFMRFTYLTKGAKKHNVALECMPIRSVWIDPFHEDIMDSDYAGEDRVVSLERAKVMYPSIPEEELRQAATNSDMVQEETGYAPDQHHRDVLQVTTSWHRNHKVPATVECALEEGWIEGTESEEGLQFTLTELGEEYSTGKAGDSVEPQEDTHHGTAWPDYEGLRQIVTIKGVNEPVEDVRCPYYDIPLVLFINVPRVDGSPLGQGDAVRLEDIQHQINRVAAIIINNQEHSQFPMMFLPQTFKDMIEADGADMFYQPGAIQGIPDHMLYAILQASGGFDNLIMRPPELSGASMQLLEMLLNEHDNLSGNVGVRQGRAPYAGASGAAIGALQEQAMGTLALKARVDEHAMTRYGRILQHAITTFYPEKKWMKVCSIYALPVIRRIIDRASTTKMNIQVTIAAGRGITRQIDRAQTMEKRNNGLLSLVDTLVELEEKDPEGKARRVMQEQGLIAPAGAPAEAPTDQGGLGPS